MPYRIKARNSSGSTVTRWDMRTDQPITDLTEAEAIAREFALTRGHGGPWQGFVEYYDSADSLRALTPDSPYYRKNIVVKSRAS